MNTYDPTDDLPEWVWTIIDRHDLAKRADSPLSAAAVLLTDAADRLDDLSRTAFCQQALTPATQAKADVCVTMIADALRLAIMCPPNRPPARSARWRMAC